MSPLGWFSPKSDPVVLSLPTPCSCGSMRFTAGGPVIEHRVSAAGRGALETVGAVLSCLKCGQRWYTDVQGLSKPHPDALPPAWAFQDLQARAARAQTQAAAAHRVPRDDDAKMPRPRDLRSGFRRPPEPEPS